jgi:myo-inositol 2-dehydrogenase / D-chiro-inositol 1-dehydrogenase
MPRVILLGAGRAGGFHTTSISQIEGLDAVCVADPQEERAAEYARRLGCAVETDPAKAIASYDADCLVVATPTATHTDMVKLGFEHGLHVFCEKPLGRLDDIRECYARARAADRSLMVAFQRRFDPEFRAVRAHIGSARPQTVKLTSRDSPMPSAAYLQSSGGIVKDCMIHDIDIANWMMGADETHAVPTEVSAVAYTHHPTLREIGEHEGVVATMQYDDGSLAVIDVSRTCNFGYDQRAEVFGQFGMVQLGNRRESVVVSHGSEGTASSNPLHSFPQRYPDAYKAELEHFSAVVSGETACEVLESQVVAGEIICNAFNAALDTGATQQVVVD